MTIQKRMRRGEFISSLVEQETGAMLVLLAGAETDAHLKLRGLRVGRALGMVIDPDNAEVCTLVFELVEKR